MLHFNWEAVTRSFGYTKGNFIAAQHPFQLIVLIFGGVIDPMIHIVSTLMHLISDTLEINAGMLQFSAISKTESSSDLTNTFSLLEKLAVRRGYGENLAKAIIRLDGAHTHLVMDWACLFEVHQSFVVDVLKNLGWTGEEKMEREGGIDHWGRD